MGVYWDILQYLKILEQESARLVFKFGSAAWIGIMTSEHGLAVSSSEHMYSLGLPNEAARHTCNMNEMYVNSQKFEKTQVLRTGHLWATCFIYLF